MSEQANTTKGASQMNSSGPPTVGYCGRVTRSLHRWGLCVLLSLGSVNCATMGLRSAVDMSVAVAPGTPKNALVYVDESYVGTLAAVEARGLRLPEGEHRISVEKTGYFPYDTIVVSDLHPIALEVELLKLPE